LLEKSWMDDKGKFILKGDHPIAKCIPGNHLVIPYPFENPEFYFKVFPEYPLVELFLIELSYLLGYYPPREADVWLWQSFIFYFLHSQCPLAPTKA